MITKREAITRFRKWADKNIPKSLNYTEIECIDYPEKGVYVAVFYHPNTYNGCRSGVYAPNEQGEYIGPLVPHIDMKTGQFEYFVITCA